MKTLCVAVVVLSLTSVCQPASLACEKLLKPVDNHPDVTGRWYLIGLSSDMCFVPAFVNAFFGPSFAMDIASTDTPNIYRNNYTTIIYGYCTTEAESILYENNNMYEVDKNNSPTGKPDVLLQSGCPDCLVIKGNDAIDALMLFSRRKTVTAAEMKEFETQSDCLGWSKPQVANSEQEYGNCKSIDDDDADIDSSVISEMISQRLKDTYSWPLKCITQDVLYYPRAAFESAKEMWNSLW